MSFLQRTIRYTGYPDENFLRAERTGEYHSSQGLFLHQRQICRSCPRGQRRCVRRVRVQFAYDGPTDNWGRSVGSEFALRGPSSDAHRRGDTVSRNILKFYTKFSPDGLRIICTGGGETRTLLTVPKSRIASQNTDCFEVVTIDAELNWNLQRAEVRATTRDGPQVHRSCAFQRLPLFGLRVGFFGPGAHMYGDVDVWYCDMPAPTARCRLPFAPCRDDELRFDVGLAWVAHLLAARARAHRSSLAARCWACPQTRTTPTTSIKHQTLRGDRENQARYLTNLTRRPRPRPVPPPSSAGSPSDPSTSSPWSQKR